MGDAVARVLIIKLGYRRGLPSEVSREICLTSVLRATVLLNLFKDDDVTWVTTAPAAGLLSGASNVRKVLTYDYLVSLGLRYETFDVVVNLEADWEFCALAQSADARVRHGFTLDEAGEKVVALPGAERALALELAPPARRHETRPDQQILFELMGSNWHGEPFVLGYHPSNEERFDVGLNRVDAAHGRNRSWPDAHWDALEERIAEHYAVCDEPQPTDLRGYIDWLNACRIVVSSDSLGLTLAQALGKKVVGLFGPTSAALCHAYGRGVKLTPPIKLNCIPCYDTECRYEKGCLQTILPEQVADAVDLLAHAPAVDC